VGGDVLQGEGRVALHALRTADDRGPGLALREPAPEHPTLPPLVVVPLRRTVLRGRVPPVTRLQGLEVLVPELVDLHLRGVTGKIPGGDPVLGVEAGVLVPQSP